MQALTAVAHPGARGLSYQDFWPARDNPRRGSRRRFAGRVWRYPARREGAGAAGVLFLAMFAAQAGVIALSPVLSKVATDLDTSTAVAGQLRTVSGLAAGFAALVVPRLSRRRGLRVVLLGALILIGTGSVASSLAPSLPVLAAAQVLIGVGVAAVLSGATAAAAAWTSSQRQTKVLSWALIGQPAAWVVGMPAIGALGEVSWRYGWIALPLAASAAAAALLVARGPDAREPSRGAGMRSALADRRVAAWALSDLLFNCGWAGTLVYSGALFVESYGATGVATGMLLAAAGIAYILGNLTARRLAAVATREKIVRLSLLVALAAPLFGVVRVSAPESAVLLAAAAFLAGARTLVANSYGLSIAGAHRVEAMGLRAAATQFGYFAGSGVAGVALALGGYPALGLSLGAFFVVSAVVLHRGFPAAQTSVTAPA